MAIRPRTLPAAISPLLLGNILAFSQASFSLTVAISAMLCGLLLQVGVNLANDYFDFKSGVDTAERLGPIRVTQAGLIPASQVRNAMIGSLLLAILVGVKLVWVGGPIVLGLAILAILGAIGYSGGPFPLASHGLGELSAFLFFGLIAVVGCYFIQTQSVQPLVWALASAVGLLNAAIMLVNNTRDIHTDAKAGKRTLAVRIGQARAQTLYCLLLLLPYLILIGLFISGQIAGLVLILGLISAPMARILAQRFCQSEGAALNPLLGRTAMLSLFFSVLLSVGLGLDTIR